MFVQFLQWAVSSILILGGTATVLIIGLAWWECR